MTDDYKPGAPPPLPPLSHTWVTVLYAHPLDNLLNSTANLGYATPLVFTLLHNLIYYSIPQIFLI